MHMRPKWIRDIFSVVSLSFLSLSASSKLILGRLQVFSGYYAIYANEADEKVSTRSLLLRIELGMLTSLCSSASIGLLLRSRCSESLGRRP